VNFAGVAPEYSSFLPGKDLRQQRRSLNSSSSALLCYAFRFVERRH
jgi:hypothetical protein